MNEFPRLDGHAGPARRLPAGDADRLIRKALDAAMPAHEKAAAALPRTRKRAALAAVLVAACAGTASAGYLAVRHERAPITEEATGAARPGRSRPRHERRPAPRPIHIEPLATPPEAPPSPPRPEFSAPKGPEAHPHQAPDNQAADLLAEANALRARTDWQGAERLYERAARVGRGSESGYAASMALAGLALDNRGDPRRALSLYREQLSARTDGPLAEEARWGIVLCHRRLGESDRERRALQAFVESHPRSLFNERARARLAQLHAQRGTRQPTSSR
jgi:tetratricopeptide (TPR) repeat protein